MIYRVLRANLPVCSVTHSRWISPVPTLSFCPLRRPSFTMVLHQRPRIGPCHSLHLSPEASKLRPKSFLERAGAAGAAKVFAVSDVVASPAGAGLGLARSNAGCQKSGAVVCEFLKRAVTYSCTPKVGRRVNDDHRIYAGDIHVYLPLAERRPARRGGRRRPGRRWRRGTAF